MILIYYAPEKYGPYNLWFGRGISFQQDFWCPCFLVWTITWSILELDVVSFWAGPTWKRGVMKFASKMVILYSCDSLLNSTFTCGPKNQPKKLATSWGVKPRKCLVNFFVPISLPITDPWDWYIYIFTYMNGWFLWVFMSIGEYTYRQSWILGVMSGWCIPKRNSNETLQEWWWISWGGIPTEG